MSPRLTISSRAMTVKPMLADCRCCCLTNHSTLPSPSWPEHILAEYFVDGLVEEITAYLSQARRAQIVRTRPHLAGGWEWPTGGWLVRSHVYGVPKWWGGGAGVK